MTVALNFFSIWFLLISFLGRFAIRLVVEIVEEVVEEDGVRESEDDGPARVAAVVEEKLRGVEEGDAELELEEDNKIRIRND